MRAIWALAILLSISFGWYGDATAGKPVSVINDVSWPNCGLTLDKTQTGIVGLTGGLANRPNPCLAYQAGRYTLPSVYVNTGYPGINKSLKFQHYPKNCSATDSKCLAYNYGYNSGLYDINQSLKNGVIAKRWWLDVETENSWDDHALVNRAALRGTLDSLGRFAGRQNLGFYSYPGQWNLITGNWHNNYPAWVATGSSRVQAAMKACEGVGFTRGQTVYGQFTAGLDQNYICK